MVENMMLRLTRNEATFLFPNSFEFARVCSLHASMILLEQLPVLIGLEPLDRVLLECVGKFSQAETTQHAGKQLYETLVEKMVSCDRKINLSDPQIMFYEQNDG